MIASAAATAEQVKGILAKEAKGEVDTGKPKEKKKAPAAKEKKADAPKEAAFVGGMPDATFKDKRNCKHTYISPRKMEDFGLDMDADCPIDEKTKESGEEEQSIHKPKAEAKKPEVKH